MGIQHNLDGREPAGLALFDGPQPGPEFTRALAHKLGNLLQVVNGNLELLSQRTEDAQLRSYLANAQAAARELTDLARGLIDEPADAP